MKQSILIFVLLFSPVLLFAQQKEWKDLITTLDEELTFFKGKKGYIQLNTWSYTDFEIHWGFLDETYLNWSIHYYNRFSGESETVTEYFFLKDASDSLQICNINLEYNYFKYYQEFPDYLFITLEVCPDQSIKLQSALETDPFDNDPFQNVISEDQVNAITIPVRVASLSKIFEVTNAYMGKQIRPKLLEDAEKEYR